jgi:hypothetical protein
MAEEEIFCASCGQEFDYEEQLTDHWKRYGFCQRLFGEDEDEVVE